MGNHLKEDATENVDGVDRNTGRGIDCPICKFEHDVVEVATLEDGALLRTDSHCLGCRHTFPTWW